uniref:Variant surface glycoprotein 778 n=1 Tax=Trypanosoma brucei TaxID=5691 RepID=M4SUC6_9TRYP|nr:variant surface glycoprotein 778 [Trypanosoma brucei]
MWKPTALLTALALCNVQLGQATEKKPLKVAAMKKVCALSIEMTKVAAYVGSRLKQLAAEADQLEELASIIAAAVVPKDGSVDQQTATLLILAKELRKQATKKIATSAVDAVRTAERCGFYAGRLTEFVSIFLQSKGSAPAYCIKNSGAAATADNLECIADDAGSEAAPTAETPVDLSGVAAAYAAIAAVDGDLQADSSEHHCGLTVHDSTGDTGYVRNGDATAAIHWGAGMFKTAANKAAAANQWQAKTTASIEASTYATCGAKLSAIETDLGSPTEATQLLKLLNPSSSKWTVLKIKAKAVANKYPEQDVTVAAETLSSIHETIKSFKQTNSQADEANQALAAATLDRLALNEKACQLAVNTSSKGSCQVSKAGAAKCEHKSQTECGKTPGCKWNEAEGKCKLTEDIELDAQKTNQETGGKDGKTEKCAKYGSDKNACEKDSN